MCGLHSTDFYFYHPILHCTIYHILYCTINNGSKPCVAGVAFSFSFLQLSQSLLTEHFVHFTMKIKVHGTFMDTICTINSLFTIPTSPLHHCTTATLQPPLTPTFMVLFVQIYNCICYAPMSPYLNDTFYSNI